MFASKSTRGFYDSAIHDSMPSDVVQISSTLHAELLLAESGGKIIEWNDDGYPIAVDPPPASREELAVVERIWRDQQLSETDGVVARHRDEQESGMETSLGSTKYSELQAYRQALRNWPEVSEFPLIEHRPAAPSWLEEQIH
ncbi:phage tail assembly chaperone [Pseudomonas frederiksbergensis]|jgi:hypothetical protein|uniref:Phage tail protein n=1 Tax=Pseudomonas frederiksbergensis TaxID=104087 RepID=A0A0B1YSM1_9PSED|nr:phage tail assembly chaperone [Pseudomonas frederiksbergensis]KHK61470.1 phage tail protein [Pseudomonas frederiksbergensis]